MKPTLLEALAQHGERRPSAPALVADDRVVTYEELVRLARSGAERLRSLGVVNGDRVLMKGKNSIELAVSYFAAHAAGAIAIPVDADLSEASLAMIREDCEPRVFACDGGAGQAIDLRIFAEHGSSEAPLRLPSPSDGADILYTTGTTGRPKGVLLTHANIAAAALNISTFVQQRDSDIEAVPVPLSHSFGLGRLRCMALVGNAILPLAGLKHPKQLVETLVRHHATGLAIVPAGFALLRRMTRDLLRSVSGELRYVELCSAPITSEVREWALELLPQTRIVHTYGLTEASRSAWLELGSDIARAGSVGVASPNVTIEVRDDEGRVVPRGTEGEIHIRGEMVMREYWRRPDLTAAALVSGFLRSGDLGFMDEGGAVYLRGRASDMINVGGMKVAPAEVENLLVQYPGVTEAVCLGFPDPNGISGERVKAFVVSAAEIDSAAIIDWLRAKDLESYKVPTVVERIDAIPKTHSGKPLRRLLR